MVKYSFKDFAILAGDIVSFVTGYKCADISGPILSHVHTTLDILAPSQPVIDEVVKSIAALVISVVSRWAFVAIGKWANEKRSSKIEDNGNDQKEK